MYSTTAVTTTIWYWLAWWAYATLSRSNFRAVHQILTLMSEKFVGFIAFGFYFKLFASGMGRHIYCLSPQQIMDTAEWSLLAQIFISINLGLTKISVCIFILRLIKTAQRKLTRFIWVLMSFIVATHIVQVVLFIIECRPIEAAWNPLIKGRCFSVHVTYMIAYLNFSELYLGEFLT